jgi:hypothetical protein
MTEEIYNAKVTELKTLKEKEASEGKFVSVKGEIDDRSENLKNMNLHNGFEIDCGLKGGKLSGGQK